MIHNFSGASPTYVAPLHRPRNVQFAKPLRCDLFDYHNELVPYKLAWSWQRTLVERKRAQIERGEECHDSLIVLQHPPVYTMGTGSSIDFLNFDINNAPLEVHRTERGGEVTYHGPGQLVMYPILNLRNHKRDLHWYLRALEEVVIRALSSSFSIKGSRVAGLTGVWVGTRLKLCSYSFVICCSLGEVKLAAIGVKVARWIAYHGVALNVTTDLSPFDWIVPCGIRNKRVGSVKGILGEYPVGESFDLSNDSQLLEIAFRSLLHEFCEVFQLNLNPQLLVKIEDTSLRIN